MINMADEAILVQQLEDRLGEVTVGASTQISKGTLLALSDVNTGAASTATGDIPIGVAAAEKDGNDTNQVKLSVWRKSVVSLKNSPVGTLSAGDLVVISGANLIAKHFQTSGVDMKLVVGKTLQDASTNEVVEVLLDI